MRTVAPRPDAAFAPSATLAARPPPPLARPPARRGRRSHSRRLLSATAAAGDEPSTSGTSAVTVVDAPHTPTRPPPTRPDPQPSGREGGGRGGGADGAVPHTSTALPAVDVVLVRDLAPAADVPEALATLRSAVAALPADLSCFTSGLVRLQVPLPPGAADALRWLRGQPRSAAALQPRAFFSPRRAPASGGAAPGAAAAGAAGAGAGAVAAAGAAWLWGADVEGGGGAWRPGADPSILPAALAGAAPFLTPASASVRAIVAGRFDPTAAPSPEWAPFGRGLVFLPRLEFAEGGAGDALAATVAWRPASAAPPSVAGCGPATLAAAVDGALAALPAAGDAVPPGAPAPSTVLASPPTHTPDAAGWEAALRPVHGELAGGGAGGPSTAAATPPPPTSAAASAAPSPAAADMARGEYLANGAAGLEALLAGAAAAAEAEAVSSGEDDESGGGDGESGGREDGGRAPPPTAAPAGPRPPPPTPPPLSKVVLARRTDAVLTPPGIDPLALVASLAARDERAYQFCVEVPGGAAFFGSSPEQLYARTGGAVASEAVAGTRPRAPDTEPEADFWLAYDLLRHPKDHAEFAIVRDWVRGALGGLCVPGSVTVERSKGVLKQGGIQHLHARLAGVLDPGRVGSAGGGGGGGGPGAQRAALSTSPDAALLAALHPTPAVCGRPRARARAVLSASEAFDRGLYAGPVGWVSGAGAEFAVAIRSALAHASSSADGADGGGDGDGAGSSRAISLYAGVGIVAGSDAGAEWRELELKTGTVGGLLPGWPAARGAGGAGGQEGGRQALPPPPLSTPPVPTPESAPNVNALAARALVEELCRAGCTTFCVAPGSRSSPLALAAARHPTAAVVRGLDERSLAFYAVGAARGAGCAAPVAVVTTSGSAVANLFPAVMEAANTGVPLLLLTADRPAELRDTGANQTANQAGIFGGYVRWGLDVPPPCGGAPLRALLSAASEAVARSRGPRPGPVHLNLQYREPLGPAAVPYSLDPADAAALRAWWRAPGGAAFTAHAPGGGGGRAPSLPPALASLLSSASRGLVILGETRSPTDAVAAARIAAALGWPVIADVLSGCRPVAGGRAAAPPSLTATAPDGVLAGGRAVWAALCPDVIFQVGTRITSKRVGMFLEWAAVGRHGEEEEGGGEGGRASPRPPSTTAWALADPDATRHDPAAATSLRVVLALTDLARGLEAWVEGGRRTAASPAYAAAWKTADDAATRALAAALDPSLGPTAVGEPAIARTVLAALPTGHALFLGNSMPVRDADLFAGVPFDPNGGGAASPASGAAAAAPAPPAAWSALTDPPPPGVAAASLAMALPPGARLLGGDAGGTPRAVAAARGVSGIDGVLSAAAGFAAGARRPATLLIGDLSFLHDTNGLALLRDGEGRPPLTAVVVNNAGGAVFSLVAVGSQVDAATLDEVWATPQRADLGALCRAHGVPHQRVEVGSTGDGSDADGGLAALRRALAAAWSLGAHSVVEVVAPPRPANAASHRALAAVAGEASAAALAGPGGVVVEGVAVARAALPLAAPLAVRGGGGAGPPTPSARTTLLLTLTARTPDGRSLTGTGEVAMLPPGSSHAASGGGGGEAAAAAQAALLASALPGSTLPPDGGRLEGGLTAWLGGACGGSTAHLSPAVRAGCEQAALAVLAAAAGEGCVGAFVRAQREGGGGGGHGRWPRPPPPPVRVQALLDGTSSPPDLAAAAAALVSTHGYDTLKLKVGRRPGGPAADAAAVAAVYAAVGPAVRLRADANRAWTVVEAVEFATELRERTGAPPSTVLDFIEEPLTDASPAGWEALADAGGGGDSELHLPVALDETLDDAVAAAGPAATPAGVAAAVSTTLSAVAAALGGARPVAAAVIKPAVVGGADAAAAAARAAAAAGVTPVASSAFESSVGLWGIADLAAGGAFQDADTAHGLGTAAWFAADLGRPAAPVRLGGGGGGGAGLVVGGCDGATTPGPGVVLTPLEHPPLSGTPSTWEVDSSDGRFAWGGREWWVGPPTLTPTLTLLLLPGFMGAAADWAPIAAAVATAYAGRVRCVAVDPPCHGGSRPVKGGGRPRDLESAASAVAALAQALGASGGHSVTLVGYSLGARLALAAAAGSPSSTRGGGVVCVSGGSPGLAPGRGGRPGRAARDDSLAAALLAAASPSNPDCGAGLAAWVRAWYAGPLWAPLRAGLGADRLDGLVAHRAAVLASSADGGPAGPAHALAAWSPGRARHLSPADIAALARGPAGPGPVLFVAGGLDARAAGAASAVAAAGDDAVGCVTVGGAGHALLHEAPAAVVSALASFVDARL